MRTPPGGSPVFATLCAGLVGAMLVGAPIGAHADGAQGLAKESIVPPKRAEAIAKKAYPGRIILKGLKRGHDGRDMRYSFAIVNHGTVHEVVVDARTGEVLNNYKVPKRPKRGSSQHPGKRPYQHPKKIPHTTV